ncbi:MAG: head-tail connector protein [Anaerovoracaceae bacterium]
MTKAKSYAKVDDDSLFEDIVNAAIEKCENETGKRFDVSSDLFCIAVQMIATEWYQNRGVTTESNIKELPVSVHVQGILNQIALNSDYKEVTE